MCWLFYSIPPTPPPQPNLGHTPCPGAFPFTEFEYSKSHQDDTREKHLIKGDFRRVNAPNRLGAGGWAQAGVGAGGVGAAGPRVKGEGSRLGARTSGHLGEFVCGKLLAAKSIFRPWDGGFGMRAGYVTGLIRNTGENPLHVFLRLLYSSSSFFFLEGEIYYLGGHTNFWFELPLPSVLTPCSPLPPPQVCY